MSGLPPPSVAGASQHVKAASFYQLAKSKRMLSSTIILLLFFVFFITDAGPLLSDHLSPYRANPSPFADLGTLTRLDYAVEELSSTPMTSLGLEADRSFHIGDTSKLVYKAELEQFVARAFPDWLQKRAMASIELYLGDAATVLTLPEIPHKIYQTAKQEPRWDWSTSTWRILQGYTHFFFDDEKGDNWVHEVFNGTETALVWDIFGPGIKRSDLLRYLLVMVEGGIYSDMDTIRLRDVSQWGQGADIKGVKNLGLPSIIVGIEADVGTREDWHKWWPRPLQVVQWTFAAAPLHPILIDTVRRIHHTTAVVEDRKNNVTSPRGNKHWVNEELLRGDGSVSIMEWTGPGVFTDSVLRYLAAEHKTTWSALKDLRKPIRIRDAVVLPVTGFSPGVGMFGAGQTTDAQAMVQHLFAGSWKSVKKDGRQK